MSDQQKPYEEKPNCCNLFENTRSPDRSDLTGEISVVCGYCGGVSSYWANAWRKLSQKGTSYIRIALKPKGSRAETANTTPASDRENRRY